LDKADSSRDSRKRIGRLVPSFNIAARRPPRKAQLIASLA
jgi:hypothetical protein